MSRPRTSLRLSGGGKRWEEDRTSLNQTGNINALIMWPNDLLRVVWFLPAIPNTGPKMTDCSGIHHA